MFANVDIRMQRWQSRLGLVTQSSQLTYWYIKNVQHAFSLKQCLGFARIKVVYNAITSNSHMQNIENIACTVIPTSAKSVRSIIQQIQSEILFL